jgi:hypothetical protein
VLEQARAAPCQRAPGRPGPGDPGPGRHTPSAKPQPPLASLARGQGAVPSKPGPGGRGPKLDSDEAQPEAPSSWAVPAWASFAAGPGRVNWSPGRSCWKEAWESDPPGARPGPVWRVTPLCRSLSLRLAVVAKPTKPKRNVSLGASDQRPWPQARSPEDRSELRASVCVYFASHGQRRGLGIVSTSLRLRLWRVHDRPLCKPCTQRTLGDENPGGQEGLAHRHDLRKFPDQLHGAASVLTVHGLL